MSAVGLTKAMRAALETRQFSDAMFKRAQEMGFIDEFSNYYPRATAALAAPRMTAKEYLCLRFYGGEPGLEDHGLKAFDSCVSKGWCTRGGETISDVLTPSGLKALNDVRAAMGSELYKET